MVKVLYIIFFISYTLSGCNSINKLQSESIYIDYNKYNKDQILNSLITNNTKWSLINEYRQSAIDKIDLSDFSSDTIIYYEKRIIPAMVVNSLNYYCSIYTPATTYSYKSREAQQIVVLNPNNPNAISIRNEYLEKSTELYELKKIFFFLRKGNLEKFLQKKKYQVLIDGGDSENLLLVAIKRGKLYHIRVYQNFSFSAISNYNIEIEPLNYEGVKPTDDK